MNSWEFSSLLVYWPIGLLVYWFLVGVVEDVRNLLLM